jgi:hypothetical protein
MKKLKIIILIGIVIAIGIIARYSIFQAKADIYGPSLIGWWRMDTNDDLNGVTLDRSGSGNNASLTGIASSTFYSTGKIGQGFLFDGTNDVASTTLDGTTLTELTVSFWVNPTSLDSTVRGLFQWADKLTDTSPFILFNRYTAVKLQFYVDDGYRVTNIDIPNGAWSHMAATLNTSNLWTVYKNGVSVGTYQDNATHIAQADATSVYWGNGYNAYFSGRMDEVRVYNRALSAGEVAQLYNQGLQQHWSFSDF